MFYTVRAVNTSFPTQRLARGVLLYNESRGRRLLMQYKPPYHFDHLAEFRRDHLEPELPWLTPVLTTPQEPKPMLGEAIFELITSPAFIATAFTLLVIAFSV